MIVRITSRIPVDVDEKMKLWCERLGVTKAQFSGMCIQAGIDSVIRGISPIDSLTDDQLKRVLRLGADASVKFLEIEGENETKKA